MTSLAGSCCSPAEVVSLDSCRRLQKTSCHVWCQKSYSHCQTTQEVCVSRPVGCKVGGAFYVQGETRVRFHFGMSKCPGI